MSILYEIVVENESPYDKVFYFFQQPADYIGGGEVYTNSIGKGVLSAKSALLKLDQLVFSIEQQYYAGAQKQLKPPKVGEAEVGQLSQVDIDLTPNEGESNNSTKMNIDKDALHLTKPIFASGVQKGAFRIEVPEFNPAQRRYNIGLSSKDKNGKILLSNFIEAEPSTNTDVQPILKFYVNTGSYEPGTVVNFTNSSANAAICDATDGTFKFKVTYNANGSWDVKKEI